MAYISNRAAVV